MNDTSGSRLVQRLFAAIDDKDTDAFLGCIHPDAEFRYGSAPTVHGHGEIREAVAGFFDSIAALSHTVRRAVQQDDVLICEGDVTYTRRDRSSITLPFVNVFELGGGLIRVYRIYIDIAPLFATRTSTA